MLSPEEADASLTALRNPDWRRVALRRARLLGGELGELAEAFLPPSAGEFGSEAFLPVTFISALFGSGRIGTYLQRQQDAGKRLDLIAPRDRLAIMEALHPRLGAAISRWWADGRTRPYQRGWDRRAFRGPANRPGLTVEDRTNDLAAIVDALGPYDADPPWLAGWGGHLAAEAAGDERFGRVAGEVLAAAIDLGSPVGEETLSALIAVGNGEHPVGIMGRHVIVALLDVGRPEGWEFIERLLLAAQRQEGLRQSILEAAHEGHPEAFDRLVALVLDHDLLRFGSVVRAAGVWLGFGADVSQIPQVEARVRHLAAYRSDDGQRTAALTAGDAWDAYIALCAQGMREVFTTLPEAELLLRDAAPERRAMAVRYLAATDVYTADKMVVSALADEDIRVAALAAQLLDDEVLDEPGVFDALAALAMRLPEKARTADGVGIEQEVLRLDRARVASLLVSALGNRPLGDLLPWLPIMDATGRLHVANGIAYDRQLRKQHRAVLFELLADRSSHVRRSVIQALREVELADGEAPAVEALLTRSASDLRRGALTLLRSLPPAAAQASAERLAASGNKNQRDAGAELLGSLAGADASQGGRPEQDVQRPIVDQLLQFLDGGRNPIVGPAEDLRVTLVSQDRRSLPITPSLVRQPGAFSDDVSLRIVAALDDLAHEHRNTRVEVWSWQGSHEVLLDDVDFLPGGGMVLPDVFGPWWDSRQDELRHDEDRDALRAYVTAALERSPDVMPTGWAWIDSLRDLVGRPSLQLRHRKVVHHVLIWLVTERANPAVIDECLDALETSLALIPYEALAPRHAALPLGSDFLANAGASHDWRHIQEVNPWLGMLERLFESRPDLFSAGRIARWYGLMRWVEQPRYESEVVPVPERLLTAAFEAGAATRDDVVASFLRGNSTRFRGSQFRDLTRRWRDSLVARHPVMIEIADQVRERLIEVELSRGDLPTPTSKVVTDIGGTPGAELAMRLLRALGRAPLSRGDTGYSDSKPDVFSQLIRVSFPLPSDTGNSLTQAATAAGVSQARLIDLAVYAPQWAPLVEQALGWPGLADGALWLHAHTKDDRWSVDDEIRQWWVAMTAERTPLQAEDLVAGAVDTDWFRRAYGTLGADRWAALDKAAKYASGGNGHARARLFAQAMLGQVDEETLVARITGKRHQDAVRALGLLPLPAIEGEHAAVVQRRYMMLREFERGSKQFGSLRQASEKAAVKIGVENLARATGYADPQRFIWAIEAREAGELASGPIVVTKGDATLTLSVDDDGNPEFVVKRSGRVVSAVPAVLRKDEQVVGLRARRAALTSQASRVRLALEAAMVAQEPFTDEDLAELSGHPVVRPMLERLLWVDQEGRTMRRVGGRTTAADAGAIASSGLLRIAHPVDFAAEGTWISWQEHIFGQEWRQPFKQVFRELYVPTAAEREGGPASHRYDGHQVQPRQALALFGRRGWLASRDSGDVSRVFHQHSVAARVEFDDGFLTAAEAELPTIAGVFFTNRAEYAARPLDAVPPIVFSEAMRDVDLVVSIAHAGGIDPEATASTTQMRAALIRETARLLKLGNISFTGNHVLIDGTLGEYSLHLGSGTVHRRPGGAVCIIPVGAQHRGRLFLPFADDDPKTAEIVSKALLLARDAEIRDPAILEQLRA